MLARIAALAVRAPRRLLALACLLLVLSAVVGSQVVGHLSSGGLVDDAAPSGKADRALADSFSIHPPNLVVAVTSARGVDAPSAVSTGQGIVQDLAQRQGVTAVRSYWSTPSAAHELRDRAGRVALVTAFIQDDPNAHRTASSIERDLDSAARPPGISVRVGGALPTSDALTRQSTDDFERAEVITLPITALVLIWAFGSVVASLVPLAVGGLATVCTLAILTAIAHITQVTVFALNLTTGLSLALGIDYSLLLLTRFREEVALGRSTADAIERMLATAGRTILFSALVVAASLASLAVFRLPLLRSVAYAGVAVVVFSATAALVFTPAFLALLGPHLDRWDLRRPVLKLVRRTPHPPQPERTVWYRVSGFAVRHAWSVGVLVAAALVLLGIPFTQASWGPPDDRLLATSSTPHQVGDAIRGIPAGGGAWGTVVVPDRRAVSNAQLDDYAARLSAVPGITRVVAADGVFSGGRSVEGNPTRGAMQSGSAAYLLLYGPADPLSSAGGHLLDRVRSTPAPAPTWVTGAAAQNADTLTSLADRLPFALGLILAATLVVVFMFTGSLLLPVKAIALTTLSLSATFGVMVWVFQDGHLLAPLFGATASGYLVPAMPILMFCMAFGMSMDYEVFLLARIREEWLPSAREQSDNTRAVRLGLAKSGRIVSAAALLMGVVFLGIASSRVTLLQMLGLGLALFVFIDATLIRGLLLPAFMRVANLANWWAPEPLARWHAQHAWSEEDDRSVG